ncbi:outer membrane lipoprotein-sorting protein [Albimonas sp. CAU 1670]|uniref:outer membrane lipoprotein-sorting protein n=1 Tax=Albimonas sp. CAU 1670 TaxID=3032599 RepID=UPI0023DC50B4|nr:outer membrane lipoprotein-sorting protein [Albimonas sp. CAU 1670]MDF2235338.1 outer membrane lipoprotein-sorting protein [Albimonas sp. CAU 1670]
MTPLQPTGGVSARVAEAIVRLRALWLAMTVALIGLSVAQIGGIVPLNADARIFFAQENPDRQALDEFEATFNKNDTMIVAVAPKDGEVFTPETLAAVGELTERAWYLPFVRRVDSITNFQHTYADGDDGLVVRDLVPDPASVTPEEAAEAKAIALDRPELIGTGFLPADGTAATGVQIAFSLPGVDQEVEIPEVVGEYEALRAEIEAAHPGVELRAAGIILTNNQFNVAGQEDGQTLFGPMFLLILLIVGLAIRSILASLAVLLMIILSALAGLGAAGWLGYQLNLITVLSPLYIMTLVVASAVHVLSACRQAMLDTDDRKEWARRTLTDHMGAIVLASVTTALGFLCLNFSISPPFRQLGNIVAVGVLAGMLYTLTLLPALITYLPIRRSTTRPAAQALTGRIAEFVIANSRAVLLGGMACAVALLAGFSQLKLEDDFPRYFDERYAFRQNTDFVEDNLTGVNVLNWPLPAGEPGGVNDPAFLAEVSAFVDWLRAQPEATTVTSLTDTIKRLNMNMHGDDRDFLRLPTEAEAAAQYLLLYELSLGYGMDLTDQVDIQREILRVGVPMARTSTAEMRELSLRAGDWLRENAPIAQAAWEAKYPDVPMITPTGIDYVFSLISYRDVRAMLVGSLVALVGISGLIMLALRDLKIGALSLVPNVAPALMGFGAWGWLVGEVTLAISVVLAATLGVVVDDTVHFLSKYSAARRAGASAEDAVRQAFAKVGMAMIVTTLSLVAGFGILAQSGFAVNGEMAELTAITISIALVADLLIMPALLIRLDKRRPSVSKVAAAAGVLALAVALLVPPGAHAQSAQEKGLAIAQEAKDRDRGWGDFSVEGEMVLRDKGGAESRRVFESLNVERPDPSVGDLAIIVFSRPRDIRGTALLTHANIEPQDDDQWLYLPAVKREKRISSSNRTGKFVSSEFSYEDLTSQEVPDYTYEWLRDEPCPNAPSLTCHVVDSFPRNAASGYSRRTVWLDAQHFRFQQVAFHNRRGALEKTLTFSGYQQYLGRYWRPDLMRMVNHQTGKETDLIWSNYRFRSGLREDDFSAQRLKTFSR